MRNRQTVAKNGPGVSAGPKVTQTDVNRVENGPKASSALKMLEERSRRRIRREPLVVRLIYARGNRELVHPLAIQRRLMSLHYAGICWRSVPCLPQPACIDVSCKVRRDGDAIASGRLRGVQGAVRVMNECVHSPGGIRDHRGDTDAKSSRCRQRLTGDEAACSPALTHARFQRYLSHA